MSGLEQLAVGLGKGSTRVEIMTSAILALVTFFFAYSVSSFLKLEVYVIKDRVVYDNPFEQYVIGNYADHIIISICLLIWLCISLRRTKIRNIACISYGGLLIAAVALEPLLTEIISLIMFPLVVILIIYEKLMPVNRKRELVIMNRSLFLAYFSLIFIVVSTLSIIVSLQPLISSNSSNDSIRNYSYEIFVILSPASVVLMILLVFSLPLKLGIGEILILFPKLRSFLPRFADSNDPKPKCDYGEKPSPVSSYNRNVSLIRKNTSRRRNTILCLLPLLALSSGVALIPYQPALNEDDRHVGVDTDQYTLLISNLTESSNQGTGNILRQLFSVEGGDRPLSLFFMFLAAKITNSEDISHMIDRSPVLLAPMLVLSVYFLTRQLVSNYTTPFLAAFLTAISSQVLIGIFAGFYANWVALIIGYFCLGYLFKFLKDPRKPLLAMFSILLIAALFAHVYTWTIISLCASVFLILLILNRTTDYSRKAIILILIVIASSAVIDFSKSLITSSPSGILRHLELSNVHMGVGEYARRWETLAFAVNSGLGGILGNSVVLLLGLYWALRSNYRKPSTLFLLIFLAMAIIPLFLGDWIIQSRTLYMIPFQIPASLGLTYILFHKNMDDGNAFKNSTLNVTRALCCVAVCALLTAAAVTVLSNFYLVIPR
jgi:hypothetical protein